MIVQILGLRVACDRPLPGDVVGDNALADVVLERHDDLPARPVTWAVVDDWPFVALDGNAVTLWFEDDLVFEFERGARRVRYTLLNEDLDDATFAHEVIDAVLPRLLTTFGHHVLHGGSVAGGTGAIVLVGTSGAGKSTLTAALAAEGRLLIGDDIAALALIDGVDHVLPTSASLRLYEHSAVAAMHEPMLGAPMAYWSAKRLVDPKANGLAIAETPVPLRAVVQLEQCEGAPSLSRLEQGVGFELLARNCFDLPYESPLAGLELLERWGPLSARVPTYALKRRFDLDELPAVCRLLGPLLDSDG